MVPQNWPGVALLRIASLYLVTSLVVGVFMAATHNHALASVHSHIGVLGWATMALTGLAYLVVPGLASSRLAAAHFWLHNAGLPVMLGALAFLVQTGDTRAEPVIAIGSILVLVALACFTANVWRKVNAAASAGSSTWVA
ncbi:MAG: cytochrome-c oxidase [Vicinamibacterales bacterium]